MSNKKTIPKEYAIVVSLVIFFTLVILVGTVRVVRTTKDKINRIDLAKIDIIENSSNVDMNSLNLRVKNAIEEKYGVTVYYGEGVSLESVNAVVISDENRIFEMLKELNTVLSKYPEGLVNEIESKGYTVMIYFVDYFKSDMVALANRNTIGQFKIYISDTKELGRAIHHEYYHILDYYIKLEFNEKTEYKDWNKYNPASFVYANNVDTLTTEYVYYGQTGANFVTVYAKFSEKEDRAETFAEMMTADRRSIFFNDDEKIKGKINIITGVLRNTFITVRNADEIFWN